MATTTSTSDEPHLQPWRDPRFRLHPQVRLRRESFGGIAFHRQTGRLIEVDREAFAVLGALSNGTSGLCELSAVARSLFGRRVSVCEVASLVRALRVRGIVEEVAGPADADSRAVQPFALLARSENLPDDGFRLSAPITVHWALTYRCGLACRHCYALPPGTPGELSREEKLQAVERLAGWGVLEVAFGGGEPTVCPDLDEVLRAVRGTGMIPSVTTSGQNVTLALARELAEACGCVQISIDRPEVLDVYRGPGATAKALDAAKLLADAGAATGANLLLVPENVRSIERSLVFLESHGIRRIVLLRPFGDDRGWWPAGRPTEADWAALRSSLEGWIARRPAVSLEAACSLSFLLDGLAREERRARLACGCSGGRRFVALRADGTLWPCSHLSSPGHRMGHVLKDDLPALWRRACRARGDVKVAVPAVRPEELICPAAGAGREVTHAD